MSWLEPPQLPLAYPILNFFPYFYHELADYIMDYSTDHPPPPSISLNCKPLAAACRKA